MRTRRVYNRQRFGWSSRHAANPATGAQGEDEQTATSELRSCPERCCVRGDRLCRWSSGPESGLSTCRPSEGALDICQIELCPEGITAALIQINGRLSGIKKRRLIQISGDFRTRV